MPHALATHYDVLVVGGGPAGSTCARVLTAGGARVAVLDRAEFPRVKLCAGWLSPGIWDVLELQPASYPHGLWEWHTCHVHYRGKDHAIPCHGWFIRRYELDQFLLRRSGAELHLGTAVKQIERDADGWSIGPYRARYLVGAGGTHCPVARMLAPARPRRAVGVQELEFQLDASSVARTRLGRDGEPELVLFDDVGGYGWNVPKSDWLNVGCGTLDATAARGAWRHTHEHLRGAGHLPDTADAELAHIKGHSYFLFEPVHLDAAYRDGALLVGDSLGLAHPITAEGILPATVSGRRAAEAILAGDPASYPARLRRDPVLADYRRVHAGMAAVGKLRDRLRRLTGRPGASAESPSPEGASVASSSAPPGTPPATPSGNEPARPNGAGNGVGSAAIARGFAWMFSGTPLPARRLLDLVLRTGA
ncbi:MAG: NAD(P)/FAD-dependent oxidoreductase [Deltaproteobacteria bacterium]|nr:MAG: NAD(P)/FAD-dependent oxidoreductase [Deltaproteobacteria bacterium]TMQ25862.1 MAG: NAD(P)/FAD-dependent oxidoreductase [Deltaproteobacteria bacterium]